MVSDSVITMTWLLVFFVIFFIYIDVRITKLRKEMLSHYMMCEKMLSQSFKDSTPKMNVIPHNSHVHDPLGNRFAVLNAPGDDDDLIPSREETMYGLQSLTERFTAQKDNEWATGTVEQEAGLKAYDGELDGYATIDF
jgi:hypothetical protein